MIIKSARTRIVLTVFTSVFVHNTSEQRWALKRNDQNVTFQQIAFFRQTRTSQKILKMLLSIFNT